MQIFVPLIDNFARGACNEVQRRFAREVRGAAAGGAHRATQTSAQAHLSVSL